MSGALRERRRASAAWIAALTALLAIAATLSLGHRTARHAPPESPGLAAPEFAARAEEARVIVVTTKDGAYRIARVNRTWTMNDRGGYPIRQDALERFVTRMSSLAFGKALTRDPKKHVRLGLDDPASGGAGIHVQVQDARGGLLADLVVGETEDGRYLRRAGESQTWRAVGEPPPLRNAAAWLDLAPFAIDRARIARVEIAPPSGVGYALIRAEGDGAGFALAPPLSRRPVSDPERLDAVVMALGRLDPQDVAPAPSKPGPARARVTLVTGDGLLIAAEAVGADEAVWVKATARAIDPARSAEATEINRRAGPWAFLLSPQAAAAFAPPLEAIAVPPPPQPEAAAPAPTAAASTEPPPAVAPPPPASPDGQSP